MCSKGVRGTTTPEPSRVLKTPVIIRLMYAFRPCIKDGIPRKRYKRYITIGITNHDSGRNLNYKIRARPWSVLARESRRTAYCTLVAPHWSTPSRGPSDSRTTNSRWAGQSKLLSTGYQTGSILILGREKLIRGVRVWFSF